MAILCVGATLALLNMAFHPLARMGALTHDDRDLRAHLVRNKTQGACHSCSMMQNTLFRSRGTRTILKGQIEGGESAQSAPRSLR